ncbi:MAG TPA: hypothetical protein VM364_14815 [Vicinamibacterales bacterium]|nr:hypothetical protein [Vicinamibacterales bacterium]
MRIAPVLLILAAALPAEAPQPRGAASDQPTVRIIVNRVKPDARADFEAFMEHFWTGLHRVAANDAELKKTAATARILYPSGAAEDGTYHYIFIIDPVRPNADYGIRRTLERIHPGDSAAVEEWYGKWSRSLAGSQVSYSGVTKTFDGGPR